MDGISEVKKSGETRQCYTCCHPNAKCTGCAVRFELHPAHDYVEGSVFFTVAAQKSIGSYDAGCRVLPTFDWENRITVRLAINEVAQVLEVLRGYREKLNNGNGLFHRTAKANTIISFEHRLEPVSGFLLGVSRKTAEGKLQRMSILLSMPESIVLAESLAAGMLYMAFGIPKVIPRMQKAVDGHVAEAGRKELKEVA